MNQMISYIVLQDLLVSTFLQSVSFLPVCLGLFIILVHNECISVYYCILFPETALADLLLDRPAAAFQIFR